MWLVCHLVDRPPRFAELHRVLGRDGRLVVVTFDPAHFGDFWLNRYFPSIERIDRARFPDAGGTRRGAARRRISAPFGSTDISQRARVTREHALERIAHATSRPSTCSTTGEFAQAPSRPTAELPPVLEYRIEWLVAVAIALILAARARDRLAAVGGPARRATIEVSAKVTFVRRRGVELRSSG